VDFGLPFCLGVLATIMATIALGILANLLTPDRGALLHLISQSIDRIQYWWARRSMLRAQRRIERLEAKLATIEKLATSQSGLLIYIVRQGLTFLSPLALAALVVLLFSLSTVLPPGADSTVGGMVVLLLIPAALVLLLFPQRISDFSDRLRMIRDYPQSTADLQAEIARST
jgi:hypothetical protein